MYVIKRDSSNQEFDKNRISVAIKKAMKSNGIVYEDIADNITNEIEEIASSSSSPLTIYQIEDLVVKLLTSNNLIDVARKYEGYRSIQEFKRNTNTIDDNVEKLIRDENHEVSSENSNKNSKSLSTKRDLFAGILSRDYALRNIIPTDIAQAHIDGDIHFHDTDYTISKEMTNCCLINLQDMLDNGTVINNVLIESPKSFQTACTISTQIMAAVASNQYGGQTISVSHLAKYLRKDYEKELEKAKEILTGNGIDDEELAIKIATKRNKDNLKYGIQTIQYQINTLNTTNG